MRKTLDSVKAELSVTGICGNDASRLFYLNRQLYPIKNNPTLLVLPKKVLLSREDLPLKLW